MFKANVLTIFPEMFPGALGFSLSAKAQSEGKWDINPVDIRNFAVNNYHSVDDTPYGGGAGMIMSPEVLGRAIDAVHTPGTPLIYFSPRGSQLTQQKAKELSCQEEITLLCGRFEGIDERVIEAYNITEISIGDFILSGGELPALVLLDAVIRLLPGVLGSEDSLCEESFENNLLEYPQYTRPQSWRGFEVPEVLLSGHHENIASWRRQKAEEITRIRRPDLWEKYQAEKP